jgi:hypothetical protein
MESLPRSETYPIISLHPPELNITNDDNKFVFVGKVYGGLNINKDMEKVYKILENFVIYDDKELLTDKCKDGIYTWLIYSNNEEIDGDKNIIKFAATEVLAPYEIGTNHQSIAYNKKVNATLIYGAGELKKSNFIITFNLISGTYTKNIVRYDFSKTKKNIIVNKFMEFFPENLYKIQYDNKCENNDSYIHNVKNVSNKLLELYKNNNFIVRLFDVNNDCINFSNNFWHIDWNLEYYKKKIDDPNKYEKSVLQNIYNETIDAMNKLIKED